MRGRRALGRGTFAAIAGAIALLAVPAFASANVYCVDTTGVDCDPTAFTAEAGLQAALDAAEAHAGADTVRIGQFEYDTNPANPDGFQYSNLVGGPIAIEGVGTGALIVLTPPGAPPATDSTYFALDVNAGAPVSISNIDVTMAAPPGAPGFSNQSYRPVRVFGPADISDVSVDAEAPASGVIPGAAMSTSGGSISHTNIAAPAFDLGISTGTASGAVVSPSTTAEPVPATCWSSAARRSAPRCSAYGSAMVRPRSRTPRST
jgi:hypothetical protein